MYSNVNACVLFVCIFAPVTCTDPVVGHPYMGHCTSSYAPSSCYVVHTRPINSQLYRFSIQNTEAAQLWQAFDPQAFPESPQVVLIQAKFVSKLNKDRQMLRHYQPCKKQQSISDWYDD